MTQKKTGESSLSTAIKKIGLIVIGLFIIYVIAGFWVLPPLLKPRLEKEISSQIGRKVTIGEIKINPLILSSTTTNLNAYGKDGKPFAGFKELLIDAELSSIVKWALTFKEIRLTAPFGLIKVLPDRTLNISDILTKFSQTEPETEGKAGLPRAVISKLQVEDGKFTVENITGTQPVTETISPVTFTLTNLSTFAEGEGVFKFAGIGPNGGNYLLDGQLSVNPLRVKGSFSSDGTNLAQLWKHIEGQVSFQIQSGTTATSGNYVLELIDGFLKARLQEGVFELKDFQLTEKGEDPVLISIPLFALQGISADLKTREIVIEQVKTADARIESWLAPDGTINFQTLFLPDLQKLKDPKEPGKDESEAAAGSPWHAAIHNIEVNNWAAVIEDRTLPEPVRFTVDDLTVKIEDLENKKDSKAKIAIECQLNQAGTVKVNGSAGIDPLSADMEVYTDKVALKSFQPYADTALNARIASGSTSTKGRIIYQDKEGAPQIKLQNGVFELKDFQITEKGKDKVLISLPSFSVQGISADVEAREIVVELIKSAGARIEAWLAPDGTINLQNLLLSDSKKLTKTKKVDAAEPDKAAGSPWQATIRNIEVSDWGTAIEDRTLPKPARITFDDLAVKIENLENKKNSKAKIALQLQVNQTGTVKVNGTAGIDPLSADIEVFSDKIALKSFQTYVDAALNAQIASGTTSSKGRIIFKGKEGKAQIRYQGELSIDGLEVKDRVQTDDFINQKQFKANGVVLDLHPNKLHVAEVTIDNTNARITIDQNGTVNVVQAFVPIEKKGEKGKENLIERLINFLILQIEGPMPMNIDLVNLENFAVDFMDGSIAPPYKTHLEITKGTMKGLSSDPSARADFKIEGTIDKSAIINSSGQMNPLNAMHFAKVDFLLKDFQLPPVSPYSGKYAGYKIDEGSLNLELKYTVNENAFTGDNKIFIDQVKLGEQVDSPDATNLPVALGVALLKGADGRITLQVPVSGNINDPKFDFGQTVISALTGAMKSISPPEPSAETDGSPSSTAAEISTAPTVMDTSPSSTATGTSTSSATTDIDEVKGEEVRFIEFEFCLSELSEHAMKKLDALAKFLNEKPDIKLGIEGTADQQMDRAKDQTIDDKKLTMLALTRANLVKNYLVQKGNVAAQRVSLKPAKILSTTEKEYGIVELQLSGQ